MHGTIQIFCMNAYVRGMGGRKGAAPGGIFGFKGRRVIWFDNVLFKGWGAGTD